MERRRWFAFARRSVAWPFAILAGLTTALLLDTRMLMADSLSLHALFTDHMVAQRDHPLPVWGWAEAGTRVEVALAGRTATATADAQGRWRAELPALEAGGPHTLEVVGPDSRLVVEDVLVGDVYLCSGQSNMAMITGQVERAEEEIARAGAYPRLRLFHVPRSPTGGEPHTNVKTRWGVCSPESVRNFSAVAYFFGRELAALDTLGDIPVGLIDSAFGGTVVEAWISRETLDAEFPDETLHDSFFGFKPSWLFSGMIAPLVPYPLTAVLWYQGESNSPRPEQYERLLTGLIRDWRRHWGDDDLPFLIVQLPNYTDRLIGAYFTWIREAQARVADATPGVHLAVAIDTADGYDLHPKQKREIGRRLALLVARFVHGRDVHATGPRLRRHAVEGDAVRLGFETGGKGVANRNRGGALRGFFVAGADAEFLAAETRIEGDSVVVRHPAISDPKHVRYAWRGNPDADLIDGAGLPAAPFRTDALPRTDLELERRPSPYRIHQPLYDILIDGDGGVARLSVAGEPFLRPEGGGGAFGAAFHTFWGRSRLYNLREDGATRLTTENESAAVHYEFTPDGMTWLLRNKTKDPLTFRIVLGGEVAPVATETFAPPDDAGFDLPTATGVFRRGKGRLTLRGLDKIRREAPGSVLVAETAVEGFGTRTLEWRFEQAPETESPEEASEEAYGETTEETHGETHGASPTAETAESTE